MPELSTQIAQRQSRLLAGGLVVLAIGALIWIIFGIKNYATTFNNGTLKLTVVPADAMLTVDHNTKSKSDTLSLAPGSHTITFTRSNFTTKTISVTIVARKQSSQTVLLTADDPAAITYIQDNPNQAAIADGAASAQVAQNGQIITQNNPLITLLPYDGADYEIDFGVSQKYQGNRDAVAIYISADNQTGRTDALSWIRAQGYDPSAYEIIYQALNNTAPAPVSNSAPPADGE